MTEKEIINENENVTIDIPKIFAYVLFSLGQMSDPLNVWGLKRFCAEKIDEMRKKESEVKKS